MLLVLFAFFVVCAIVMFIIDNKTNTECFWGAACIAVIFAIITIIIACCNLHTLLPVNENMINEKIAMYQEENERIESEIDAMVDRYMQYETDIIDSVVESKSSIALVSVFPELKSDALVQKQLDTYLQNNEKIKELKAEKIEIYRTRWLVYFGN